MNVNSEHQALTSEEKVVEITRMIIRLSDSVHDALRRLSSENSAGLTSYALLTEEYALRSRANILLNEAKRFIIPDFVMSQAQVLASLSNIGEKINNVTNLNDLSELLSDLTLFSNSMTSKKKQIISLLFENLMGDEK